MLRIYTKNELLNCAAALPASLNSEAIARISAIADTDVVSLIRWRQLFDKKGIKPSIKISKEDTDNCIRLLNEYRTSKDNYFRDEDTRSAKAKRLVRMMSSMQAKA
ncbi:MAG: hypothetical protein IJ675_01205 [Pseudobutyrivibrio sp.]|nr:hypothetical protein [Pseudobutyrivibrio sp.]